MIRSIALAAVLFVPTAAQAQVQAIVGTTVIDGNGGPPVANATIVIDGKRIAAVGPRATVKVPAGARIIDGSRRFVLPGFIDLNNHITYGPLPPLLEIRDRIARGEITGPRLMVAATSSAGAGLTTRKASSPRGMTPGEAIVAATRTGASAAEEAGSVRDDRGG